MSATSCLLSEEQFLCCICLDVFTDPVTIPCGHNFCKNCITQHWNINSSQCQCPMCKKLFKSRPELPVNTFINEMAAEFRQSAEKKNNRDSQVAKPGEVPCDICTGTKLKAMKSCLTCIASYCSIHLDPHMTSEPLKRHSLTDPVENMEAKVCKKHKKILELFCKTDQTCVCSHCTVSEHMAHNIVSLKDEYQVKKRELEQTEAEIQQMIRERKLKIQKTENIKAQSKEDAETEIADGVRIFTKLMQTAERDLNELIETIEEKQKTTEEQADGFIKDLEQEISALTKKTTQLQQVSLTQDHLHLLQSFTSMTTALCSTTPGVSIHLPSYQGTVAKAVAELEKTLSGEKEYLLYDAMLRRAQHYVVDVVLEHRTANPWLILSDDGKQVRCGKARRDFLSDNAERFSLYAAVLAQQSFSSGRFYYEVQVTGKTDWTLGVVKLSVNRKEVIPLSPVNGYWAVGLRNGHEFLTYASPVVSLSLNSRPQKVGVFVSYEEGLVSFYDVDTVKHLYSFTDCCFTESVSPYFSPGLHHDGRNSAPLIISPVSNTV
ncbi:E3 ubiquitin-protein ligase TRIM39-like isoform X2 [Centropristis striata]|nr:E3 ubiquitin-protein ligase TRIM39-like isoform X2 [Centropristis striata]XP_059200552.1 E3 ubiquitin-protein ligase TRIM39-like isoform X2 [Centropristis striata]XP_059200553.1 E3 ubiquitin-protein ligase TRIM39-like isoform X2 [Centropristis striata]